MAKGRYIVRTEVEQIAHITITLRGPNWESMECQATVAGFDYLMMEAEAHKAAEENGMELVGYRVDGIEEKKIRRRLLVSKFKEIAEVF